MAFPLFVYSEEKQEESKIYLANLLVNFQGRDCS